MNQYLIDIVEQVAPPEENKRSQWSTSFEDRYEIFVLNNHNLSNIDH